jgi:hypothetical protein
MQPRIEPFDEHNMAYASAIAKELHGLGAMSIYPFDEAYNRALIAHRMHDPTWWGRLARDTSDTEYCGIMVGNVQTTLFSQARIGVEHALYVRRGTKFRGAIAMKLVRSFVAWCYDVHDCIMVQSGDIASVESEAARALYIRCGFKNYGALYSHERTA